MAFDLVGPEVLADRGLAGTDAHDAHDASALVQPDVAGTVDGRADRDGGQDLPGRDALSPGDAGEPVSLACEAEQAARAFVHFRIPRASDPPGEDFYRLPFPNDIRKHGGKISLHGHPLPGARLLSYDLVDRYLRAIEDDATGFGTNQAVYLRLSREPALATLAQAVDLVDITPGSPEYGHTLPSQWRFGSARTPYLCHRNLLVRPAMGRPLRPGTTFAAIVRSTARDQQGNPFGQDGDFAAMLASQAPAEGELAAAWAAYAPLRAYLADTAAATRLATAELAAAAVFTTEAVEAVLAGMHASVLAAPAPTLNAIVRCSDAGAVSPCDDGKTGAEHVRGCPAEASGTSFDEYQGTITLPVFQQGTPPYLQPENGGGIVLDGNGRATLVRSEQVCFALAIPRGSAPAAGWPAVVYSHGTGGSYRSAMAEGLAEELARGEAAGGAAVPTATLGYDGVLHGPRQGTSTQSPDLLVYNLYNPRAARDNALQAAADLLAIPAALAALTAPARIDPAHIALLGHSQGGNAAALAAARDAGYGAAVMSGTGGMLSLALVQKSRPVSAAPVLALVLGELGVDADHPVLSLMQMYFERSDPINFARRLFREPAAGARPRHVLHVYGTADSYAPVDTQRRWAQAAGFSVALPLVDPYPELAEYALPTIAPPVTANQPFGSAGHVTAAQLQYAPDGYDGHFVSTRNPAARTAIQHMLVTFARDSAPTIAR